MRLFVSTETWHLGFAPLPTQWVSQSPVVTACSFSEMYWIRIPRCCLGMRRRLDYQTPQQATRSSKAEQWELCGLKQSKKLDFLWDSGSALKKLFPLQVDQPQPGTAQSGRAGVLGFIKLESYSSRYRKIMNSNKPTPIQRRLEHALMCISGCQVLHGTQSKLAAV